MQGSSGFWLREQRALRARNVAPPRKVAEHRVISEIWPNVPAPEVPIIPTPGPPPKWKVDPNAAHQPADQGAPGERPSELLSEAREAPAAPARVADLEAFAHSEGFQQLRSEVAQDPKALETFLEKITSEDPQLMKVITIYQQDFLSMLTTGLLEAAKAQREEVKEQEPPVPEVVKPSGPSAEQKAKQKILQSLQPTTKTCHTIVRLHNPYSCAVCKATTELSLCSSCHSVRFCCRDHQRRFWPRHQAVCRFISSIKGGLLQQVAGRDWVADALPQIVDTWTKSRGQPPEPWQLEQLVHLPHCKVCSKAPATLLCTYCSQVAYCSEECKGVDSEHQGSWQCRQVAATAVAAELMHKAGGGFGFLTDLAEGPLPDSIFRNGWQDFVDYSGLRGMNGEDFRTLHPTAQQIIIDSLSFPMSVLEACRFANHPWNQPHIKIHILNAYGCAMADMNKYEEWLRRAPHVKSIEVHFVTTEARHGNAEASCKLDLCEECKLQGQEMTLVVHETSLLDFVEEEIRSGSSPPFLRVAYSPALARLPLGDSEDLWEAPMKRIAELQDDALLVITERTMTDIYEDEERLELFGFTTVVPSRNSNFPSPLTLFDGVRSDEENPIGLTIWNMSLCAFKAGPGATSRPRSPKASDVLEDKAKLLDAAIEVKVPEDCAIGDRVLARGMEGEVTGLRCRGYPNGVEVRLETGERKHFLPNELSIVAKDLALSNASLADQLDLQDPRFKLQLRLKGPWICDGNTMEDVPFNEEVNPASFVVSLTARCDGGRGFRSPLSSRDHEPPSGYVLYVDGDDRWAFWLGDGHYWSGVQGPSVELGRSTELQGVYDAQSRCVRLFVDGQCVGQKHGVDFVPNQKRPLRIGAGRSENPVARYFFHGEISNIKLFEILT